MTSDGGESAGLDLGAFVEGLFVIHTHAPSAGPPAGRTVGPWPGTAHRPFHALLGRGARPSDGVRRALSPRDQASVT